MCHVFANEVLIPSKKFKEQIGESRHDISLVELQSIQCEFSISVDALMTKAAQPNFKEEVEKSLYPMEYTTRFNRLVYRALASEVIIVSKAESLLDKSVYEVRETLNLM